MQLRPEMMLSCPAGRPVINQILNGYREGRVTRGQLETAVHHLLPGNRELEREKWREWKRKYMNLQTTAIPV